MIPEPVKLNTPSRDTTADLLKGIAVILMIQVHLVELFALQEIYNSSTGKFLLFLGGPPAAPVFMAVMGYFLFHSRKSTGKMILRGVMLILGGILLNIGLNFNLLLSISQGIYDISPYEYIFGSDILPLAGLSIIIIAVLRRFFRSNVYVFIFTGAAVLAVTPLLPDIYSDPSSPSAFVQAFLWGDLKWSYFPLFPWLFYPLLGFIFGMMHDDLRNIYANKVITLPLFAAALVLLILTFDYGFNISSTLEIYYHHGIVFAGWTIIFLSVFGALIYQINRITKNFPLNLYVRWIGRNVTLFYIFQWLIIGNIATELYKTQNGIQLILWFAVVLTAVTILVLIFNHLKVKEFPREVRKYLQHRSL